MGENQQWQPRANFGWPLTEGDFDQATYPDFTPPIYSYPDWTSACAITGGAFYNPATTQFPAQYVGKYFFQQFLRGNDPGPGPGDACGQLFFRRRILSD